MFRLNEPFGTAIYLSASYFNHSCEPNAITIYTGRKLEIVAMRDIYANTNFTKAENVALHNDDTLSNVSK